MDTESILNVARWEGIVKYKIGSYRIAMVMYSIGNGLAKELICMTHGHEQWWGIA